MSISARFYKIDEDPKTLTKTLIVSGSGSNLVAGLTVTMKDGFDHMRPVFTFRADAASNRAIETTNYIHIPNFPSSGDWGLYYFVDRIESGPTQYYTFYCHLDVLMTYTKQLKELNCTLDRSETIFNGYLPDSEFKSLGYRAIACVKFPQGLNNDSYILMTTG